MRLLAVAVFASILLAGCGAVQQDTHFTVAEDAPSNADAYTGDGYDLRVKVVDQNGTPVPGAAVVFFHLQDSFTGESMAGGDAEAGAGGARANAVAFWEFSFSSYEMIAGARTDADGMASADLEPGQSVHVAAGDADGLTTEVRMNVAVGQGGDSGTIEVPLYPDAIQYTFDVSYGNHVGTAGTINRPYEAFRIAFSEDSELGKAYQERIYDIGAAIQWTNTMEEGADLFVGIGTEGEQRWIGDDQQQYVLDGAHSESVSVSASDLDGHRQGMADSGYFAYIYTDWASLSFDGLPVTIEVEAALKGSNIQIN